MDKITDFFNDFSRAWAFNRADLSKYSPALSQHWISSSRCADVTYVNSPCAFISRLKVPIKPINDEVWRIHADERISFCESIMPWDRITICNRTTIKGDRPTDNMVKFLSNRVKNNMENMSEIQWNEGSRQAKKNPHIREKLGLVRSHPHTPLSIFFYFFGNIWKHEKKKLGLHPPTHFRVFLGFLDFLTWQNP